MAKKRNRKQNRNQKVYNGKVTSSADLRSLIVPKTISRTRKDIADWKKAENLTQVLEHPKWHAIQQLYTDIEKDALLTSQYQNRVLQVLKQKPVLYKADKNIDEAQTDFLQNALFTHEFNRHILDAIYKRVSLVELEIDASNELKVNLIPREHIDPNNGVFYPDYYDIKHINYRELPEYGKWVLEFNTDNGLGLFNKAIPHVLFKRFAQSCLSELCEIYGIPPRVLKTNTQDPTAMNRSKRMMQEMGSAAWFIIDDNENFEFAKGVSTNGDVYTNLTSLCDNQNSLLISGAIIGQDTKNGSRSKDESAREVLQDLIDSDLQLIKRYWNSVIIPALKHIGVLAGEVTYGYEPTEDVAQLWEMTREILPYKEIDDDWIKEKFGIKVTGNRNQGQQNLNLNHPEDFF